MAESRTGTESVSAMARRYDLRRMQIFTCRRKMRRPVQAVAEQMFVLAVVNPRQQGCRCRPNRRLSVVGVSVAASRWRSAL